MFFLFTTGGIYAPRIVGQIPSCLFPISPFDRLANKQSREQNVKRHQWGWEWFTRECEAAPLGTHQNPVWFVVLNIFP
jgi:hypothetical protein